MDMHWGAEQVSAICCPLVCPPRAHASYQALSASLSRRVVLQVYVEDVDPEQAFDIDAQLALKVRAWPLGSIERSWCYAVLAFLFTCTKF